MKTMEDVFPHKPGVYYDQLRMTPEGLYSVTRRRDGERIMAMLRKSIPHLASRHVTDATACVGSDTLRWSMESARVDAIEWKRDNATVLRHNVRVFGATNVRIHEGDATRVFQWKTDVLYIDPPWGGPEYYKVPKLDVFVGDTRLDTWVESVLRRKDRPAYIVLKLPRNYHFARIQFLPTITHTILYRIRNFVIAVLS